MKRANIILLLMAVLVLQACKKEYLNRPPLGSPTSGTFYQTDADILNGTGPLYNGSWGGYNGTSLQYIGDVLGGNSLSDNYNGRGAYLTFSATSTDPSGALQMLLLLTLKVPELEQVNRLKIPDWQNVIL
jgi:hypothetical protein